MTPAGVVRIGVVHGRPQRVPRAAVGRALLPTPATRDHHAQGAGHNSRARSSSLATVIQKKGLWPTPRANKPGGFSSPGFSQTLEQAVLEIPRGELPGRTGNTLNPPWVEWLMGYPNGWTE